MRLLGFFFLAMTAAGCTPPTASLAKLNTVAVPGHPFSAVPSQDGNWLFVSLSNGDERDGGAIALLRRHDPTFVLQQVVPIRDAPKGLALSHDGRRLALAAGNATMLVDVDRLISGQGDPVLAHFGSESGAIYVAFSPDDRLLAVSERKPAS